jgi:hypothetical protein
MVYSADHSTLRLNARALLLLRRQAPLCLVSSRLTQAVREGGIASTAFAMDTACYRRRRLNANLTQSVAQCMRWFQRLSSQ